MKRFLTAVCALVMAAALALPALAANFIAPVPAQIKIDGHVSDGEYGDAIYRGVTLAQAEKGIGVLSAWWFDGSSDADVNFDLYINNDSEYIYVGCAVHNVSIDSASTGGSEVWKYQSFAFTLAPFVEASGTIPSVVFEGKRYEQYTGYTLAMLGDGRVVCIPKMQGIDQVELYREEYKVVYDKETRTMTYEVGVPLNPRYTRIDLENDVRIAFSAVIALNYENNFVSGLTDGSNRLLIGTGAAFCGGPDKFPHKDQAIVVELNHPESTNAAEEEWAAAEPETEAAVEADYKVAAPAGGIELDGKVSSAEWGAPVFSVTPQDCLDRQNDGWDYWSFSPMPKDQHADIYLTNDGDYVYVACELVGAQSDDGAESAGEIYAHPHFGFTIGAYDSDTVVKQTYFDKEYYECYTHYCLAEVGGEKYSASFTQGMQKKDMSSDDYAISYDAETKTYTYECRVPYRYTNVDISYDNIVAMSFDIGDANISGTGNRYLISRGAEKAMAGMGPYNYAHGKTGTPVFELALTESMVGGQFQPTEAEAQGSAQALTVPVAEAADNSLLRTVLIAAGAVVLAAIAATVIVVIVKRRRKKADAE